MLVQPKKFSKKGIISTDVYAYIRCANNFLPPFFQHPAEFELLPIRPKERSFVFKKMRVSCNNFERHCLPFCVPA